MKKFIYILSLILIGSCFSTNKAHAQQIFNDTILFKITRIALTNDGFRYLFEFQNADNTNDQGLSGGIGTLNLCGCYCDSIWDAWPGVMDPTDPPLTGGVASISYLAPSGNDAGLFNSNKSGRQRGRLNIWQMPGSFVRSEPFTLPIVFKAN